MATHRRCHWSRWSRCWSRAAGDGTTASTQSPRGQWSRRVCPCFHIWGFCRNAPSCANRSRREKNGLTVALGIGMWEEQERYKRWRPRTNKSPFPLSYTSSSRMPSTTTITKGWWSAAPPHPLLSPLSGFPSFPLSLFSWRLGWWDFVVFLSFQIRWALFPGYALFHAYLC
jgi:hypothetical protein